MSDKCHNTGCPNPQSRTALISGGIGMVERRLCGSCYAEKMRHQQDYNRIGSAVATAYDKHGQAT